MISIRCLRSFIKKVPSKALIVKKTIHKEKNTPPKRNIQTEILSFSRRKKNKYNVINSIIRKKMFPISIKLNWSLKEILNINVPAIGRPINNINATIMYAKNK
jgi:hypothetical protein